MFILMVVVFVLGYTAIALEHPMKVDKAASALLLGVVLWVLLFIGRSQIFSMVNAAGEHVSRGWQHYLQLHGEEANNPTGMMHYITEFSVMEHLAQISTILFFLLGAMTIVETVDQHQGFKLITDKIKTTSKIKLLWIISFLTFFMSAALDNLTTTIVLVALLRKLIADNKTRWFFASMVVLAANAGGAWSPIGDVTTIMLWIGGQITALNIIIMVFVPSLVSMLVPLVILSFTMKGTVERPVINKTEEKEFTTFFERRLILFMGVGALLFVPVFKTLTHLPPYMGMLFGLGILWVTTEIIHRGKPIHDKRKLTIVGVLERVDVPTIFFFLGILTAVASLESAGHLSLLATYLDQKLHSIYAINIIIGLLSSIVDNVPLVAGAMGMYDTVATGATGYPAFFMVDGAFWEFIAYCAGTGGSILIIGSAAGVAAMGMEKIDFIWYMKRISLLALAGYIAGAAVYYFQIQVLHL